MRHPGCARGGVLPGSPGTTRSIAGDLLLLALDDAKGRPVVDGSTLDAALAGTAVAELVAAGGAVAEALEELMAVLVVPVFVPVFLSATT